MMLTVEVSKEEAEDERPDSTARRFISAERDAGPTTEQHLPMVLAGPYYLSNTINQHRRYRQKRRNRSAEAGACFDSLRESQGA
jgi:hypothetical protein